MAWGKSLLLNGAIEVRPMKRSDRAAWMNLRTDNREWLRAWESTYPPGSHVPPMSFGVFLRQQRHAIKSRREFPMVIAVDGEMVGRVSITGIEWGAVNAGSVGYWISEGFAGQGIVPKSLAMLMEYGFHQGLHRIEVAICPENSASLRVVRKLHLREEGVRKRAIYIDGQWRDHRIFAMTENEERLGPLWARNH